MIGLRGLPRGRTEFMARSSVLAAAQVFSTPQTVATWRTKSNWGIVAPDKQIINPTLSAGIARGPSRTIAFNGIDRDVYQAYPREVAAVIMDAARRKLPPVSRRSM
jgi:hypothetical protein